MAAKRRSRPSDDSVAYTKYLRYDTSSAENTQYQENVDTGGFSALFRTDILSELMTFLGIYDISEGVTAAAETIANSIFARVWIAGRVSLTIGIIGALLSAVIGCLYGGIAAYFGGIVDDIMMLFFIPFIYISAID